MSTVTPHESRGRGGRSARRQARVASGINQIDWHIPVNTDRPTEPLDQERIEAIHDGAMRILEGIGIDFLHDEARAILKDAGCDVHDGSTRVRFDRDFIMEQVAKAPKSFDIVPRNAERTITVGGDKMLFINVSSPPNAMDLDRGRRVGDRAAFQDFVKLTQYFNCMHLLGGYPVEPLDIHASVRHLDCLYDKLTLSDKVVHAYSLGTERIEDAMEMVLDSLRVREIPLESSPIYGNERAPVTIIVFADFECPHCRAEAPKLRQTVDQFRGRARLIFKHFPLSSHPRAKQAAIATEAAKQQGKFWEMHDIVFENQTALEDEDIVRYAQDIGLDMGKFRAAYESKLGRDQVESDRALGEKLEITGTPAVFINGRYFNDLLFGGTFAGWVDDALRR